MFSKRNEVIKAVTRLLDLEISRKNELQEMVELASYICQSSIAMINLIDHEKQHIRFKIGTELSSLIYEDSFCQYIRAGQDILVISDTLQDQRFYSNPLVAKSPYIRFYAGVPLITQDSLNIGSLCVMGSAPKQLTESEQHRMRVLARRVVEIMELEFSLVA